MPVRPTSGARLLLCSCGAKVGGVNRWGDRIQYTPIPGPFEQHLKANFTDPPGRIFDATQDGPGGPIGDSLGRARIVCKCGRERVVTDDFMQTLLDGVKPKSKVRLPE